MRDHNSRIQNTAASVPIRFLSASARSSKLYIILFGNGNWKSFNPSTWSVIESSHLPFALWSVFFIFPTTSWQFPQVGLLKTIWRIGGIRTADLLFTFRPRGPRRSCWKTRLASSEGQGFPVGPVSILQNISTNAIYW